MTSQQSVVTSVIANPQASEADPNFLRLQNILDLRQKVGYCQESLKSNEPFSEWNDEARASHYLLQQVDDRMSRRLRLELELWKEGGSFHKYLPLPLPIHLPEEPCSSDQTELDTLLPMLKLTLGIYLLDSATEPSPDLLFIDATCSKFTPSLIAQLESLPRAARFDLGMTLLRSAQEIIFPS